MRGFQLQRVRTETLTLPPQKGEANLGLPLQWVVSTDLVRTCINGCTT